MVIAAYHTDHVTVRIEFAVSDVQFFNRQQSCVNDSMVIRRTERIKQWTAWSKRILQCGLVIRVAMIAR